MKLLQLREKIKKKKPHFIRQDAHKKGKIGYKWRRPKGSDSKIRRGLKGYRRSVSVGWGSPRETRGLHKSGLNCVVIYSAKEIENLDSKKDGMIISSGVGMKKKASLINKAKEKGIKILNIKNPDEYVKNIEENVQKRKKERDIIKKKKEKKTKDEKKEKAKGELEKKVATEDEKKENEKKERDKVITKKQM
jgi:large subunit ribosomal protein L32e|tara:strand:- start:2011 stop:2586 length:576 start_codon:yes stop_codon:yes gene_type:complete